jgi:hypothetical protein
MSDSSQELTDDSEVRSFKIDIPETELQALRARIGATRWPEKETVADHSLQLLGSTTFHLGGDGSVEPLGQIDGALRVGLLDAYGPVRSRVVDFMADLSGCCVVA